MPLIFFDNFEQVRGPDRAFEFALKLAYGIDHERRRQHIDLAVAGFGILAVTEDRVGDAEIAYKFSDRIDIRVLEGNAP